MGGVLSEVVVGRRAWSNSFPYWTAYRVALIESVVTYKSRVVAGSLILLALAFPDDDDDDEEIDFDDADAVDHTLLVVPLTSSPMAQWMAFWSMAVWLDLSRW